MPRTLPCPRTDGSSTPPLRRGPRRRSHLPLPGCKQQPEPTPNPQTGFAVKIPGAHALAPHAISISPPHRRYDPPYGFFSPEPPLHREEPVPGSPCGKTAVVSFPRKFLPIRFSSHTKKGPFPMRGRGAITALTRRFLSRYEGLGGGTRNPSTRKREGPRRGRAAARAEKHAKRPRRYCRGLLRLAGNPPKPLGEIP